MKTLFLYAPDRYLPTIPYSSSATLQACLRAGGYETGIVDLNVELFDHLCRGERIGFYADWVAKRFRDLESKTVLSPEEHGMYRFLAPLVGAPSESLLRAEESAAILRDPARFYDPEQFNRAFDDLTAVIAFLYAATPYLNPENRKKYVESLVFFSENAGDPLVQCYQESLIDRVLAQQPDLLAFTVPFHMQLLEVLKFVRLLKERAPHVKTLVGGPTINDYRDTLFADPRLFDLVDYAIMGDGDNAVVRLLDGLTGKMALDEVPNLYFRKADGTVHVPTQFDLPVLDTLPTPDFDGVPFEKYLLPERLANFQTSRGCYYGKCTFCGDGFRRNFRMRNADLVYQDVKHVAETWDVKYFLFWDSLAPPRTLINMAKRISEEGPDVRWFAETKFEYTYANPKTVETLYAGGARFLQFGFESAVDRVLKLIDKGNELEKVDACLDTLAKAGIGVCTTWFLGFPTETEAEAKTTYDFVTARRDKMVMSVYSGTFNLGRDTILFEHPERFGIRVWEGEDGEIRFEDGQSWDKKGWQERMTPRGDLPLLCQGGYLLYHGEAPEKLREIVGRGRAGPIAMEIADLDRARPVRPERNRITRYRFEPSRERQGEVAAEERAVPVAFVGQFAAYHRLDEDHVRIFEAADGKKTVAELAALAGGDRAAARDKIAWMIDRAILIVPQTLPQFIGLKQEPVSA